MLNPTYKKDLSVNQLSAYEALQDLDGQGQSLKELGVVYFHSIAKETDLLIWMIAPIAQQLLTNSAERIIFIPQGELFLVPFAALVDDNNQYLIENHTILTSPSIQRFQPLFSKWLILVWYPIPNPCFLRGDWSLITQQRALVALSG